MSGQKTVSDFFKSQLKQEPETPAHETTPNQPWRRTDGERGSGPSGRCRGEYGGRGRDESVKKRSGSHPSDPWEGEDRPQQDFSPEANAILERLI
jgi:hypothetical protein